MTGRRTTVRSKVLAALVVCAAVAGAVAFLDAVVGADGQLPIESAGDAEGGVAAETTVVADGTVSLNQTIYGQERGDVVRIGISLTNTDTATVTIGDVSDNNWIQNVTVQDGNGDDFVTLVFNTYTAGTNNRGTPDGGSVYFTADGADSVTNVAPASPDGSFTPSSAGAKTLAAADYEISAVAGRTPSEEASGGDDAVATLSLGSRSSIAVSTYVLPDDRKGDLQTVADVLSLLANGNLTEASKIAEDDVVVVKLEVSGIEGVLFNETHNATVATPAANVTDAFFRQSLGGRIGEIPTTLPSTDDRAGAVWDFNVDQTNSDPNTPPDTLGFNGTNTLLIADPGNDTYWLRLDTALFGNLTDGDELQTNFTMDDEDDLASSPITVFDTWDFEAATATGRTPQHGRRVVPSSSYKGGGGVRHAGTGTDRAQHSPRR